MIIDNNNRLLPSSVCGFFPESSWLQFKAESHFIFVGSDKRHYEQFADGTVKDIEDEIPFDVPEGWAWCRLGEVCTIVMGSSPDGKSVSESTNGKEFHQGKIYFTDKYLNESNSFTSEVTKIAPINSLLLCVRAPVGIVNITQREICIGRGLCCLFPNYEIDIDFWFYWMQFFKNDFETKATGTTFKAISVDTVKSQLIPIPPMEEQIKIVKTIDNLFEKIDSLNKNTLDLQTAIKQAKSKILDLAIHGKLVPQNPNDEPAEELLKRIATSDNRPYEKVDSSEIDWKLPKNWTLCHFGDIATIINGKTQSKVENPDGKYPIYGSGGIMGRADDYICPENCTIIGRKGSINNPIFVEEKFWNVDTAFGLCPSEAVLPKFLFYFCEYFDFTTLDSSTTLPSLTKTNIQQIIFALPPIEEQERILDKTDELFDSLDEIVLNLV